LTCGGLHGALVLACLRRVREVEIIAVVRSSRVLDPKYGFLRGAREQIRRSGLPYSLYLWASTTLADWLCMLAPIGAVPAASRPPGPRVLITRDVNEPRAFEFLADARPDLMVSAFFNQRVGPALLALPRLGCLNIHPSLLPDAKGVDPVFQALLHAKGLGVTVHAMNAQLDAGRILAQQPCDARAGESVFAATARLFAVGAELLAGTLGRVAAGDAGLTQTGDGNYQSWPDPAQVRTLSAQGGHLIKWRDLLGIVGRKPPPGDVSAAIPYASAPKAE